MTVPRQLVEGAGAEVRAGHAASLSAYVSQALEEKLERDQLQAALDAMDAAYGPPTVDDETWARRVLGR